MKILLCLLFFFYLSNCAIEDVKITAVSSTPGDFQKITVTADPSFQDAEGIAAKATTVTANSSSHSVSVEAVGFTFVTPLLSADDINFYFGVFEAAADFQSKVETVSISGSLVEIIASFHSVFVYYEYNEKAGFQFSLQNDPFDCTTAAKNSYDCLDLTYSFDLSSLSWGTIQIQSFDCPSDSGYDIDCKVYALTTNSSGGEISFTAKIASQNVLYNDVQIGPYFAKIDVTINYPWTSSIPSTAKVGLFAITAGKTVSGAVVATKNTKPSVEFSVDSNTAYFSWDTSTSVGDVYYSTVNESTVQNYDCSGCSVSKLTVIEKYKSILSIWTAFGWNVEFIFFSWTPDQPSSVYWDPALGFSDSADVSSTTSGAVSLAHPFVITLSFVFLFFMMFKRN